MKLTKEEKKALAEDIMNDIPDGFAIFSPWTWLWLIQIMLMMLGGGFLTIVFHEYSKLGPEFIFPLIVFVTLFFICIPNGLIAFGRNTLGIKYLRLISKLYIVLAMPGLVIGTPVSITAAIPILCGVLVLWITYTIRFQAFALHRKEMSDWGRERIKKNKAFKEKIKENRRRSGK